MKKKDEFEKRRYKFGPLLRRVREKKGITLKVVAEKADVSESLISQIEREKVSPSVDTLITLAEVLEVDLEYLFQDYRKEGKVLVTKNDERDIIKSGAIRVEQFKTLNLGDKKNGMDAYLFTLSPGEEEGHRDLGHPGSEIGYVLSGVLDLYSGDVKYQVKEGETVSFASSTPHLLKNNGDEDLILYWVVTPPR